MRTQQPKRKRPRHDTAAKLAQTQFSREVLAAAGFRCENCGCRAVCAHHVVYEQELKRRNKWRWDPRIGMALCQDCHDGHHGQRRLRVARFRDETLDCAFSMLGAFAYDYLRRRYVYVRGDPRLESRLERHR